MGSCFEKCQTNDCDPVTGKCPPSPPKNMEIEVIYPRSLTLSWESSAKDEEEQQDKLLYHVGYKLLTHMSCNYQERDEEWNKIVVEKQPIVISGLEAHASYNVCLSIQREFDAKTTVEECDTAGTGIEVPTLNVTELMCVPKGFDSVLCSAEVDGTCVHYNGPSAQLSFSLSYDDCNGTNLTIEESELLPTEIDQIYSGRVNHTFSGLIPGHKFLPGVQVKQVPVPEQRTTAPVYTDETAPPPVKDLKVFHWNETNAKVVWNAPCPSNGKILGYKITVEDEVYEISSEDVGNCLGVNGYSYCSIISHLEKGPTYRAQITAETSNFQSQKHEFNFSTYAKPSEPLLREGERYKNALHVSIDPPSSPGGRLRNCTFAGPKESCVLPFQGDSETMKCEIENLSSGTKYTIEAYCCNVMFCGERLEIEMSTRPLPVFRGSVRRNNNMVTNSTIPLTLPKLTNAGESETNLVVFVERIKKDIQIQRHDIRNKSLELLSDFRSRQENSQEKHLCGKPIWIAAVLPATYGQIEVGDGNTYGGFQNCPLEHGESYSIGVLGITDMQGEPQHWQTVWQQLKDPMTVLTQEQNIHFVLFVILCVEGALIVIFILMLIVLKSVIILVVKSLSTEYLTSQLPFLSHTFNSSSLTFVYLSKFS
ncbi:uncharacterized protein [Palaemon carinicauda]|uniref:uncharacterized protein n=1 Tax=Palaemon carinicauda TaxID=392227 RepID=UPI0035B64AED